MTTDAVTDFEVEGDRLEVVKDFVLLGSQVNEDARSRPEIRRRIALGRAAMGNLRHIMLDKTLAISVKVMIIQTMVFPIVTYGSESWTVMKEDRRKIDAFELWFWRRACRVKWTDKVSNKSILTWVAPYNKLSLDARILKLKMSYFGHVMRRNGMEKDLMLGKVGGRRRRGRQRMRWMEGILTETGNGLKELRELVESLYSSGHQEQRKAEQMTSSSEHAVKMRKQKEFFLWNDIKFYEAPCISIALVEMWSSVMFSATIEDRSICLSNHFHINLYIIGQVCSMWQVLSNHDTMKFYLKSRLKWTNWP